MSALPVGFELGPVQRGPLSHEPGGAPRKLAVDGLTESVRYTRSAWKCGAWSLANILITMPARAANGKLAKQVLLADPADRRWATELRELRAALAIEDRPWNG